MGISLGARWRCIVRGFPLQIFVASGIGIAPMNGWVAQLSVSCRQDVAQKEADHQGHPQKAKHHQGAGGDGVSNSQKCVCSIVKTCTQLLSRADLFLCALLDLVSK